MSLAILIAGVLFLAWSNGANDNFKGVATLWGSGTASFRRSLIWATAATATGSLVSVALAGVLARTFSGAGLVSASLIDSTFLTAIGLAAAATVGLATVLGMPTSTTHALTGALVGVGWTAAGLGGIAWDRLLTKFAQPLLLSPVLAVGITLLVYPVLSRTRRQLGVERDSCLCIEQGAIAQTAPASAALAEALPRLRTGHVPECSERYAGRIAGISAQRAVDAAHYASGGAVCFARAVNDTPKIAALLLATGAGLAAPPGLVLAIVASAMAIGGWVQSRRVAQTMSKEITNLNPGQGLTASLATAFLVLGASRMGVPVSTTHVSCGSIFGIGLARRDARWRTISRILLTWVTTLPLGALLGTLLYRVLST